MSLQQYNTYPVLSPARVASTANVAGTYFNGPSNNGTGATLTIAASSLTIDTVVLAAGDTVLLKNQTNTNENGLYIINSISSTVVLQRRADMQNIEQFKAGYIVPIAAGAVSAGFIYTVVEPLPAIFGINALTFIQS